MDATAAPRHATSIRDRWPGIAQGVVLLVVLSAPLNAMLTVFQALSRTPYPVSIIAPMEPWEVRGAVLPLQEVVVLVVPTVRESWVLAAIHLATWAFVTVVAYRLHAVLFAADTDPFDGTMSTRLARLAVVILVGGVVVSLLNVVPRVLLNPLGEGLWGTTGGGVGGLWLAFGCAALVGSMAAVFRHGEELEDDLDGLV